MRTYKGEFRPTNPSKYQGTTPIIYRSSWELSMMIWCDTNNGVQRWGSESVVIPYLLEQRIAPNLFEVDEKPHRYFVDFNIQLENGKVYLIEIKPKSQTTLPKTPSKRVSQRYQRQLIEFNKNICKWTAAKRWADEHGCIFQVWTEETLANLGIKLLNK